MDVGGSECPDAYRDISGRATQEAKAEYILENRAGTTAWTQDDHTDVGGRAMPGAIAEVVNVRITFSSGDRA